MTEKTAGAAKSARGAAAKSAKGAKPAKSAKAAKSRKASGAKKRRRSLWQLLKESWFYRIYFALLLMSAAAIAFGLVTLSGVMREYEQTRPVHCAEEAFAMFEQRDWSAVRAVDESAKKLRFESPEQYAQYLDELTAGKQFAMKNLLSIDDNERKYSVVMDGQKLAEMTLEPSGERTKHNFEGWKLKGVETMAFASSEYTITAPASSTVTVNGRALGQEDAVESGIATAAEGNLPDGVAAPTLTKYAVYMALGAPEEVRVTDANGAEQAVTRDSDNSWSCGLAYDDSIKEQVESSVVQWGRRLAAYTTGDYSKSDLSNACVNPSPARTYIRNMENNWAATHSGYDFENIRTYDYYIYSDSCFSCKISFNYIVHYRQQDKSYPTNYTMYFAKNGDRFKLYSFTMDGATEVAQGDAAADGAADESAMEAMFAANGAADESAVESVFATDGAADESAVESVFATDGAADESTTESVFATAEQE